MAMATARRKTAPVRATCHERFKESTFRGRVAGCWRWPLCWFTFQSVRQKYTLQPLRQLRQERVSEKTVEVSHAQATAERARLEAERARLLREAEHERALAERRRERELLEQGAVRAQDLQQAERFWIGASCRVAQLMRSELGAEQQARALAEQEQQARGALAEAQADAKALERHHERFTAEQQKAAQLAEEEAMLDRWTADKYGPRRG
jgi:hypothetical protein